MTVDLPNSTEPIRTVESLTRVSREDVHQAEMAAFIRHINNSLGMDSVLKDRMPISSPTALFEAVQDGVLICRLINVSVPDTIDMRRVHTPDIMNQDEKSRLFKILENQRQCLDGARRMGCSVVNIGPTDLMQGNATLICGLLWQIIKCGLLSTINLGRHPELNQMGGPDLNLLPPEALLLRWFNYHLERLGMPHISNLSTDLSDGRQLTLLMHAIAPEKCSLAPLELQDDRSRVEAVLAFAAQLDSAPFASVDDVLSGNEKLNLALVAGLFNKHTGIVPLNEALDAQAQEIEQLRQTLQRMEVRARDADAERAQRVALEAALRDAHEAQARLAAELFDARTARDDLHETLHDRETRYASIVETNSRSQAHLQSTLTAVYQELQSLAQERDSLRQANEAQSQELIRLRSRVDHLTVMIEHFKVERERSDQHVARLREVYRRFPTIEALARVVFPVQTLESLSQGAAMTGALIKKARWANSWKTRIFVLKENFLFYFKERSDEPAGVVRIDDAYVHPQDQTLDVTLPSEYKECGVLAVDMPMTASQKAYTFYLASNDAIYLQEWRTVLTMACGWWTRKSTSERTAVRLVNTAPDSPSRELNISRHMTSSSAAMRSLAARAAASSNAASALALPASTTSVHSTSPRVKSTSSVSAEMIAKVEAALDPHALNVPTVPPPLFDDSEEAPPVVIGAPPSH